METRKTSGARLWVWLLGGLFLLLSAASIIYGVARSSNGAFTFSAPDDPPPPQGWVPAVNAAPEIDVAQLSESLAQALDRHLEQRLLGLLEELKDDRLMQARLIEERQDGLAGQIEAQSSKLADLGHRLDSVGQGLGRLLDNLEAETRQTPRGPAFVFRGIEIWHGEVYALLEHEGRIVPVREGESRLGWRIHAIDRDGRALHVGDGMQEHVLEVQ